MPYHDQHGHITSPSMPSERDALREYAHHTNNRDLLNLLADFDKMKSEKSAFVLQCMTLVDGPKTGKRAAQLRKDTIELIAELGGEI